MKSNLKVWRWDAFQELVELERARVNRYGRCTTSLLTIRFENLSKIYTELGRQAKEVSQEVAKAVSGFVRSSDAFCARHEALFFILLTETPMEGAWRDCRIGRIYEGGLLKIIC